MTTLPIREDRAGDRQRASGNTSATEILLPRYSDIEFCSRVAISLEIRNPCGYGTAREI